MKIDEIRDKFINFMKDKGHILIDSAPLVPSEDATTLFTGSGMQPLVPYLLGETHPLGNKLVSSQKCFRAGDIEEIGDNRHTTFFEMLGNWSFGDYFKETQIKNLFEFLIDKNTGIGLDPRKLYVTVFSGDKKYGLERDMESANLWKELFNDIGVEAEIATIDSMKNGDENGMKVNERIFFYNSDKNWWSRAGAPENMPEGEPGGPDTEIFYDFGDAAKSPNWKGEPHPNSDSGQFIEITNTVFMQYFKKGDKFIELPKKNVDFGGGLERLVQTVENQADIFLTSTFKDIVNALGSMDEYEQNPKPFRIIIDHLRASTFLIADGVLPSNVDRGYLVRRLIRRAYFHLVYTLKRADISLADLAPLIGNKYKNLYKEVEDEHIFDIIRDEEVKFSKTIEKGVRLIDKLIDEKKVSDESVFKLFSTYGVPFELTKELLAKHDIDIDESSFKKIVDNHKSISRKGSEKKFKGGLADASDSTIKYHTATHLLHQALRNVLGEHVNQKGSNITDERLRFDFSHSEKMTDDEKIRVEEEVNKQIENALSVSHNDMSKDEAVAEGAIGVFGEKYKDIVRVYTVGGYSKEFCGGPHVSNTSELGVFKIKKEESVSQGVRRIKAVLL